MDHEKFWELSWFEWSLYARRHKLAINKVEFIEEGHWARFRIQWADFLNVHRKKGSKRYKPTDLITLSFDKPVKKEKRKISPEEVEKRFGKVGKK